MDGSNPILIDQKLQFLWMHGVIGVCHDLKWVQKRNFSDYETLFEPFLISRDRTSRREPILAKVERDPVLFKFK